MYAFWDPVQDFIETNYLGISLNSMKANIIIIQKM